MFYRQKILLSLIEISGYCLQRTDLQKLLFLFCQETGHNFYDFFPHKYGPFSNISYYDKGKLIEQGYLKDCPQFETVAYNSFLPQLKNRDRKELQIFSMNSGRLRGRELIRKTYLEYPEYVSRSDIIDRMLHPEEREYVRSSWNAANTHTLFTIGYEGKTIDDYIRRLLLNNVKVLVDVRYNPFSRKHGFSRKEMKRYIENAGVQYLHIPELGIASHLRKDLDDKASYTRLFDLYAQDVLPHQSASIKAVLDLVAEHKRIALTCFEADCYMCHRHKITEFIGNKPDFNYPIIHI